MRGDKPWGCMFCAAPHVENWKAIRGVGCVTLWHAQVVWLTHGPSSGEKLRRRTLTR